MIYTLFWVLLVRTEEQNNHELEWEIPTRLNNRGLQYVANKYTHLWALENEDTDGGSFKILMYTKRNVETVWIMKAIHLENW